MSLTNINLRKEFLEYLNQPDLCELFYNYMKSEQLAYILEFYLACDGLKTHPYPRTIIGLIYKHYLSNGKSLSSSKIFSLPDSLLSSIKQHLNQQELSLKFYEQAQEYVLKYMLQMCYPKFIIEQQNFPKIKRIKYRLSIKKNSLEGSTLINENENSKELVSFLEKKNDLKRTTKFKSQYNLAQQNPSAFFQELKHRLLAYQTKTRIEDDPSAVLDIQIAKTIDDADNYLFENSINYFTRHDSGVGTDSSEKNSETYYSQSLIDVIWYPSLDSNNALLSTIRSNYNRLTFKEFRQLFKKQTSYRYFFKTICTPDINKEQYIYRELTMDDELIPFYDGKIFVQLDRI